MSNAKQALANFRAFREHISGLMQRNAAQIASLEDQLRAVQAQLMELRGDVPALEITAQWAEQMIQRGEQGYDLSRYVEQLRTYMQVLPAATVPSIEEEAISQHSPLFYAISALEAVWDGRNFMRFGFISTALERRFGGEWSRMQLDTPDGQTTIGQDLARPNGYIYRAMIDFYNRCQEYADQGSEVLSASERAAFYRLDMFGTRRQGFAAVLNEWKLENQEKADPNFKRPPRGRKNTE